MSESTLDYLDDIEIYLASEDLDAMLAWLGGQLNGFEIRNRGKKGCKFRFNHSGEAGEGMIVLNAGRTGFTSIWLNTRTTPWKDDVDFGRAAFAALGATVRCNESAWSKGDDPDRWLQIDHKGENLIQWVTEEP